MERTGVRAMFVMTVLVAFIGLMAGNGWAESRTHQNYVRLGLGANIFTDEMDDAGYDAGIDLNVAYGRYLAQYLVVEAGFDYFGTDQDFSGSTALTGAYSRDDLVGVGAILATLKAEFPAGPVALFAGAGFGGYFVSLSSEIDTANLGSFDVDDEDTLFGFHVVAGCHFDINDRIFIGGQGMYRWTEDVDIQKNVATIPIRIKGNLEGYVVTFSAGFRF